MRSLTTVLVIAISASVAFASCPNSCSGHGTCADGDICTCYTRKDGATDSAGKSVSAWLGPDCSQRTCPYAKAWVDDPIDNNNAHQNAECSNAGVCDRSTGLCVCFPGYEGKACDRTVCPNSCSGHGTCQSMKQFAIDHVDGVSDATAESATVTYANAWDAKKMYGCKCEAGFRGPDCSMIECPSGTDPQGGPSGAGYNVPGTGRTEYRDCSGRGRCNYATGLCECFKGFYGEDCSLQSTLV